jgi:hypothetical protein
MLSEEEIRKVNTWYFRTLDHTKFITPFSSKTFIKITLVTGPKYTSILYALYELGYEAKFKTLTYKLPQN